jgi:amidase
MKGNDMGTNWRGLYDTTLLEAHSAWRHRADELSDSVKATMLVGHYFNKHFGGHFYAKAQNRSRDLRAAYDAALSSYDVLLMPTVPMKATPLPPPDAPRELKIHRAVEMVPNAAPFNASGHPAMSIPCGMSEGLPIGLMLVGKYYDEATIYRAAAAFEGAGDWTRM